MGVKVILRPLPSNAVYDWDDDVGVAGGAAGFGAADEEEPPKMSRPARSSPPCFEEEPTLPRPFMEARPPKPEAEDDVDALLLPPVLPKRPMISFTDDFDACAGAEVGDVMDEESLPKMSASRSWVV